MKKTTLLLAAIFIAGIGQAQIGGKLKGLKDKAKDKTTNSSSTNVAVSKYDKHMKAAKQAEDSGDFIKALKEYNSALEEKSGDYQASSGQRNVKDKAKEAFIEKGNAALDKEDCNEVALVVDDAIKTLGPTPSERESWENSKNNCEQLIVERKSKSADKDKQVAAAQAMATLTKGEGHASSDFVFNGPKQSVGVGEDLVMRFMFEKTMIEYAKDFGVSAGHYAYGFVNIYVNGEMKISNSYSFASNISKVWDYIDIPVNLDPEFINKLQEDNSLLKSPQDIWMMQQCFNPEMSSQKYVMAAMPYAKKGDFKVTVEFGLGEKGAEKASGIVAKKEVLVKVDEKGMEQFAARGPRYMRPLKADEKGSCEAFGSNFGSEHIGITVNLPHPPKYYNQKWCQEGIPATCDYDHGDLKVLIYLDGKEFEYISSELWNKAYENEKSLNFIVLSKTDAQMFANSNTEEDKLNGKFRVNYKGDYISKIIDMINGGKIAPGEHTVKIKVFAEEVVPKDEWNRDDFNDITWEEFFEGYAAIAEGEVTFNLSKDGIAKYQAKTYLDVPEGKVAKWATTESQLKAQISDPNIIVKAVNIRWNDWEVNYDAYKRPVSRETSADVYYFNKKTNSHRYLYSQKVKADYTSGSWSKAYWNEPIKESMNTSSGQLDPGINYPVPGNLKF